MSRQYATQRNHPHPRGHCLEKEQSRELTVFSPTGLRVEHCDRTPDFEGFASFSNWDEAGKPSGLISSFLHPICFVCFTPMEKPDQLRELWEMQHALNMRIGVKTEGMTEEEKTKWLLNYCRAMNQEIAELTDSVPWKWWAKYQEFDEQNAKVEVVDLFHFLISLAQVLGMSADDVFNAYVKKNEVNFKRQETGYQVKDHQNSKHI